MNILSDYEKTDRKARWKNAGLGEYYCSLCCEIGDHRKRTCSNCHAIMYTEEEYNIKFGCETSTDEEKPIAEIARYCCYPCDFEFDGACLEGKDPQKCGIALDTARTLYAAGFRKRVIAFWRIVCNGFGICSNCNRMDAIDPLSTHCRYCGARMIGAKIEKETETDEMQKMQN